MTPSEMIDWIEDHARKLYERTGRPSTSRLVYLTSPYDFMAITNAVSVARPVPPSDAGFELHTPAGYVEVAGDPSAPRGAIVQVFRCPCDSLFLDDSSRTGRCPVCREWTPGDAVPSTRATCARCAWPLEIEGLPDEDADRLETLHRDRCFAVGDWVRWLVDGGDFDIGRAYDGDVVGYFNGNVPAIKVLMARGLSQATVGQVVQPSHADLREGRIRHIVRNGPAEVPVSPDEPQFESPPKIPDELLVWRDHMIDLASARPDGSPHLQMDVERAMRRPDGFDQAQIDAAKAVLLSKVERKR